MTMKYNGSEPAVISVSQKKEGEIFSAEVQPGGQFTINGVDKKGTLGTEISINVNSTEHTKIHTRCSVEIDPGYIAGDFEVVETYSQNGGLMCAVDSSGTPPSSSLTCGD